MTYEEATTRPGLTLVEFFASWCPHCRRMMPIVEEIKEIVEGKVVVCQYDIDEFPAEAEAAGAESVPTFIIYNNGREVWRKVGEMPGDEIIEALQTA
ncbi:MAG: thioredoxin family protein [Bacteroidales bacterium]|nr:thioredoxin family protein [Bacteroidales bacterium]